MEQVRLVAARVPLEAEAVQEAILRSLWHLLQALLLLHPGAVEAAAAALVEDAAVDERRVSSSERGLEGSEEERHLAVNLRRLLFHLKQLYRVGCRLLYSAGFFLQS